MKSVNFIFSPRCALLLVIWMTSLFSTTQAVAQQKVSLKDIPGEWELSDDITPAQAREKALGQAKAEALRQAGIPESISSSDVLLKSVSRDSLKQFFETLTTVDLAGEIGGYKVTREEKNINAQGRILYKIWIDATVVIHASAQDSGFGMEVRGLHDSYQSEDKLSLDVQPMKDGFLTLFILSGEDVSQIFPNKMEHQQKLEALKTYHFPTTRWLDYEVSTEKQSEVNYLITLFTQDEIPFTKEPTVSNILTFVSSIPQSGKSLKMYSFLIRK